ncbi:MAG: DNA polymerase, partial [Ruthenibacterium sp.]
LRKETVDLALQQEITNPAVRRKLEVRQELSKTSVKKYNAMAAAVCLDDRVRGTLQFYGANRTGRWSGRIIQPQNLPRTHLSAIELARALVKSEKIDTLQLIYGSVPNTLSQLARTALIASPGKAFVDADFAAIEARVIAWLAGEEWVLDVFRTHGKIYEATASQMFGVPLEKIVKGEPEYELRQRGKVATLALGYQGGANALTTMDTAHAIPDDDKPALVRLWRDANPAIVSFWYDVEDAAVSTLQDGNPRTVRGIGFSLEGHSEDEMLFLAIHLPSGRSLLYPQPFLASNRFGKPSLHFMGSDQITKKWGVQETYGGKLVENITQAVARDCLAQAIENLEAAGYPVVFHVHDEVICEVMPGTALDAVIQVMAQPIFWAPGLPLAADGWVGAFYTKD